MVLLCAKGGIRRLKKGDKVLLLTSIIDSVQMFPKKHKIPEVTSIPNGSYAIIEEIYPSGWGIVKFENGKRVLVSNLKDKFISA
jgi:hypothetical protein